MIGAWRTVAAVSKPNYTGSCAVIPKRHRYYWEARPENRHRKLLMQITLPRLGRSPVYEAEKLKPKADPENLYGLDSVLYNEVKNILRDNRMIVVYLRAQMEITDFYRMRHTLRKEDIFVEDYPNHVMESALKDTYYRNLADLYQNQTLTVYSKVPKVKELLTITKKNPYISLIGGLLDDRLMSANQILEYSKLPLLTDCQGQLSLTLSMQCASTYNLLQRHQALLSQYLQQHASKNEAEQI